MNLTNKSTTNKSTTRKQKTQILSLIEYGKMPPQAIGLERAVLGAILIDGNGFDLVYDILKPECFYMEAHQRIFIAMINLNKKLLHIEILTLIEELKFAGDLEMVGGPHYVTKLTHDVVELINIEAHARIVLQKFIKRDLIRITAEVFNDAYDEQTQCFDDLDKLLLQGEILNARIFSGNDSDMNSNAMKFLEELDLKIKNKSTVTGIRSGYPEVDRITNGWQPGDLIILAARPSIGKTALALNLARNAALNLNKPTSIGFFSLEMGRKDIFERLISIESEINYHRIRMGQITDEEHTNIMNAIIPRLLKAKIIINDRAGLNWIEVRGKARTYIRKYGIELIIVDYLQLMNDVWDGERRNREQQIAAISRNLKAIAKDLHIPVIALSQLSRGIESRGDKQKVPVLSDLRESGAIEQDADLVLFLYKDDEGFNQANSLNETPGQVYVKIAKHRNGTLGTVRLISKLFIQKFYSESDPHIKGQISAPVRTPYKTDNFDEGINSEGGYSF